MYTLTKPKMAFAVTSGSAQTPSASSCKSCSKCQEIYDSLTTHIMNDHAAASVNDNVLNNVLLNILSLLSGSANEAAASNSVSSRDNELLSRQEESHLAPVTVISKATKQRPTHHKKNHLTTNSFTPTNINISQNTNIANISNDVNNVQVNNSQEISSRLSFQPDLISNLFTSIPRQQQHQQQPQQHQQQAQQQQQQQKVEDIQTVNTNRQHLLQPKLIQVPDSLDLSFMVSSNNDIQTAAGFIAPDGSLTPAGISFLLANQNKVVNTSGKSDLDVADILINKMPIPSLNKGLDPGLLQLSTLYLQQLAMNTQQQQQQQQQQTSLTNSNNNNNDNNPTATVDFTSELISLGKSNDTPTQSFRKPSIKSSSIEGSDQSESIQQLLAKHKQISGLIEALSNQQKNMKKNQEKQNEGTYEQYVGGSTTYTINPHGQIENIPNISLIQNNRQSISGSTITIPSVNRQQAAPAATIKVNSSGKSNHISSITNKKNIPIIWDQVSSNLINIVKQQTRSTDEEDVEDVQFQDGGKDDDDDDDDSISVDAITSSKQNELQALQNLIIENPKSIVVVADSKNTGTTSEHDPDSKVRLSTVSMVPVSQLSNSMATESKNVVSKSKVLYRCNVCGVTFSVASTLQMHMKSHVVEKKETCNYCHMSFENKDEYYTHVLSHRGEENVFTCQFCQKIFTSKGDYNKHITQHSQRRPYLCSHCHKAFRDPGSLTKHERIHTGEQPYVCEVCNRGFAEKSSLRKHVRVHSGEQPYKCNQCDKSFSISGNLQRHLFIHTGLRPFKCTQCAKAFNNPSHLRRHVKNLHGKKEGPRQNRVITAKSSNNNLVFPRIMSEVDEDEESI